jgi:hypothetical protein
VTFEGRPVDVDSARCQIRAGGNVTICNVGKGLPARPLIDPATSMDVDFDPREPRQSIRFGRKRLRGVVPLSEVKVAGLPTTRRPLPDASEMSTTSHGVQYRTKL